MIPTLPIVSICIPTFNRAGLLAPLVQRLRESMAGIPAGEVEVIVSDNASTDETRQVLEPFGDMPGWTIVRAAQNIGMERNILAVTERARGLYAWILSDHQSLIIDLSRLLAELKRHPFDLAYARVEQWPALLSGINQGRGQVGVPLQHLNRHELGRALFHLGNISALIFRREHLVRSWSDMQAFCWSGYPQLGIFCRLPISAVLRELPACTSFPSRIVALSYDSFAVRFIRHPCLISGLLKSRPDLGISLRHVQCPTYRSALRGECLRLICDKIPFLSFGWIPAIFSALIMQRGWHAGYVLALLPAILIPLAIRRALCDVIRRCCRPPPVLAPK